MLHSKLGSGTYASVYATGEIAIKSIKHANFESGIREIAMIIACDHPNIIGIHRIEYEDLLTKIYMRRYTSDLRSFLDMVNPLPIHMIYRFAYDLIAGVNYLHNRGIIHCDLKPQNLLRDTGNASLVICDFGIAILESEKYHTSHVQTCTYRAPEVDYERHRVQYSARIDIWSVGCILYEMVTGSPLITFNPGQEDSSIYACGLFEIFTGGVRKQRLKLLRDLSESYVLQKISDRLLYDRERHKILLESGFIQLIAKCLHPNHNKRINSVIALSLIGKCDLSQQNPTPQQVVKISAPQLITVDEMLCTRCISVEVLETCKTECLLLAEKIYRAYISTADDQREEINYACLFIASCVYSGAQGITAAIEKKIPRATLLSAAATIMLHKMGKILC